MNEKGNRWNKVVTVKYGEGGFGWSPTLPYGSYGYSLRRHIAKGREGFCTFLFRLVMILPFSDCHDRWCEEPPLRELFPAPFVLALDRDASVAETRSECLALIFGAQFLFEMALLGIAL